MSLRYQIAQKIHACTEVYADGRENDRFRDLIDLQLLAGLVADEDWAGIRVACLEVFEGRVKHPWPPSVTIYESWSAGYRSLAEQTQFSVVDVRDAADAVHQLIARIHTS